MLRKIIQSKYFFFTFEREFISHKELGGIGSLKIY